MGTQWITKGTCYKKWEPLLVERGNFSCTRVKITSQDLWVVGELRPEGLGIIAQFSVLEYIFGLTSHNK